MDINMREPKGHTFEQDELHIIDALTTARAHIGLADHSLRSSLDLVIKARINAYEGEKRASLMAFIASEIARKRCATLELLASAAAIVPFEGNETLVMVLQEAAETLTFQGDGMVNAEFVPWQQNYEATVKRHQEARKAAGISA